MNFKYVLCSITSLIVSYGIAQVSFTANGNSGFGSAIGGSSLSISENAGTVTIDFNKGVGGDFNDTLVIYFDTGVSGRTVIDANVDDENDVHRRAISSAGFDASDISFPPGFEATHAIAVNTSFGGLWSIPATGFVSNGGLPFVVAVGHPGSNTSSSFQMTFSYTDLGTTPANGFDFVATYLNGSNGFLSNEGYGGGFQTSGNYGNQPLSITTYYSYPDDQIFGVATTATDGLYADNSTWTNGNPPASTDQITIDHNVTVNTSPIINNSLTINSGKSLTIDPDQVLTLNDSINNIGTLTFSSSSSGSAQLINGPNASISQPVEVNRFIPALDNSRRAFRFVTSAVTTSGSIFENWQENGGTAAGLGTHITGNGGATNGFDTTGTNNPSMFDFNHTTGQWAAVTRTNSNTDILTAGAPYRLMVRGDRNYNLGSVPADPVNSNVTLRATGTLNLASSVNTGPLNPVVNGFSFVGNPYQATVDIAQVTKNNVNPNFIYVWNPNANTRGAYETVTVNNGTPVANQFIQPGQSFFVSTIANGPASLDFKESDKQTNGNSIGFFSTPSQRPFISVALNKDYQGNDIRTDELRMFLDGNNAVTIEDAIKLDNLDENIASLNNGLRFSIENKAMPIGGEVIALDIQNYRATAYSFKIVLNNLNTGISAKLHDAYLNTNHDLNNGENIISFTVDPAITGAAAANRFSLQFSNSTLSENEEYKSLFNFYPNPTENGVIILELDRLQHETDLIIYDSLGQMVDFYRLNDTNTTLDLSKLSAGIYVIKVQSGDRSATKKLIIH